MDYFGRRTRSRVRHCRGFAKWIYQAVSRDNVLITDGELVRFAN